ncbi:MAG: 23S rRNA pseudouridine(1911/1915/1917) synthase RluD [Pseudohongiellaceae bacterium]|jgi:23S rRNA pseudouridine1911/1915/1917 synthase
MLEQIEMNQTVALEHTGLRLDQAAALLFPEFSRARLQDWIREGQLTLNGERARAKDRVLEGDGLILLAELEAETHFEPESMSLCIVHEDEDVIIVNKPVGLVVHPAAGNYRGTLLNGLLAHCPDLQALPRAGIVHRLDKDTSGLLVVAKTLQAHQDLVEQLQERRVSRHYEAVVQGVATAGGTVDAAIGRHPVQRQKRAVTDAADARPAVTHYRVRQRFRSHSHLSVQLETGRTHQIRVHMAHVGMPIVGDQVYGGRWKPPRGAAPALLDFLQHFKRQALHAAVLGFHHATTGEYRQWEAPLPADMQELLQLLGQDDA